MAEPRSWLERARDGDRRALGRLCRLLEEGDPSARAEVYATDTSSTQVIGVTGSPGVGKSSLVAALLSQLTQRHDRVGVLAVDPSSPFSGGAILGDRIRMQRFAQEPGVFIRSLASRGSLGGIARATADMVRALVAWGAGAVVVETVGVGQDEYDVMLVADTTCLVVAPEQGDDVQANKAGIMEVADVIAVNKADLGGAARAASWLRGAIALGQSLLDSDAERQHHSNAPLFGHHAQPHPDEQATGVQFRGPGSTWLPPVVECSATTGRGVSALLDALGAHGEWLRSEAGRDTRDRRRVHAARRRIEVAVLDRVNALLPDAVSAQAERLAAGGTHPDECAFTLLEQLSNASKG